MKLKFENIDKFIKEYYLKFLNINLEINIDNNKIIVSNNNLNFSISILNNFICSSDINYINIKGFKELTIKLINYLNINVQIPIILKINKNSLFFNEKSVFILGNDGNIQNLSKNNLKLLKYSKIIYTNNKKGLIELLNKLNIEIEILDFENIYKLDFSEISEIVLFQYGDYFEQDKEINKICIFLEKYFDKFFIQPYYSNFINKYSLSHTNYGSLLYLGNYDLKDYKRNKLKIKDKIVNYIINTNKILSDYSMGTMISLSGLGIEFKTL